ncbi:expressed protein [Batrachochytrium dendrobatidis JAM81]|uniref:Expressed protein n=1 Tax=Batrachochytrium dendrobatidis (strain JAM81 / FGSC 10211) TaxID=684364 RepID=F4NY18_BATDJ|nr:uncharacterized protein BATDEDRAFT_36763 [Batrachochytrium dendrobatidis JAM81]EGF81936.1 expressed protein [Batrachochytrium dendrobatidis JAM81]KAK5670660.1 Potassium transporter [Batrachochytrium dendrobatidis]|eukprot:XP_006677488.1 expressed protein [Batrachochytrium dendrobatidis JAM81]
MGQPEQDISGNDSAYGSPVTCYNHHRHSFDTSVSTSVPLPRLDCIDFTFGAKPISLFTRIGRWYLLISVRLIPLLYCLEIVFFSLLFAMVRMHNNVELESYMPAIFSGILAVSLVLSLVLVGVDYRSARRIVMSSSIKGAVMNHLAYYYFSTGCTRRYEFLSKIRNSGDKMFDSLAFFVYFRLKGWKYVVTQIPRQWGYMLFVWWFIIVGNPLKHQRESSLHDTNSDQGIGSNLLPAIPDMLQSNTLPQAMFIMASLLILAWMVQLASLMISVLIYPVLLALIPMPSLEGYCNDVIQERTEQLLIEMNVKRYESQTILV